MIIEKLLFCFFMAIILLVFSGGFKGQVRWPDGPKTSLSLFSWFVYCYVSSLQKKLVSPQKRTCLLIFQCLPLFLPVFLSLSLSLYIYIYMLSRQLGDHVFAFEQVNGWDAFAHQKTEIFRVTPFPPCVSSAFFKIAKREGAGAGHSAS